MPVTGAIERQQRHQQNIGLDFRRVRLRLANTPLPAIKRRPEFPRPHDQRLAAPRDRRQRQPRASFGELLQQRQWIDLALERHEAGDDRARRNQRAEIFARQLPSAAALRVSAGNASRSAIASWRSAAFASSTRTDDVMEWIKDRIWFLPIKRPAKFGSPQASSAFRMSPDPL